MTGVQTCALPIFCNSAFASALFVLLKAEVALTRETYHDLDIGAPDFWAMNTFNAGYCKFHIMIDPNLDGVTKKVDGNVSGNATLVTGATKYAYAIDMSQIAVIYFDAMGRGVQTPHTANIDMINNNTIRRVEQDATLTLAIGDPRTCGIIAFTG